MCWFVSLLNLMDSGRYVTRAPTSYCHLPLAPVGVPTNKSGEISRIQAGRGDVSPTGTQRQSLVMSSTSGVESGAALNRRLRGCPWAPGSREEQGGVIGWPSVGRCAVGNLAEAGPEAKREGLEGT